MTLELATLIFTLLLASAVSSASGEPAVLEVIDTGTIRIAPSPNQTVLLTGPLQLNTAQETITITASLLLQLISDVHDLKANASALSSANQLLISEIQHLTGRLEQIENSCVGNVSVSGSCGAQACSPGYFSSNGSDLRCICPFGWTGKSCDFYVGACGLFDLYGNAKTAEQGIASSPCDQSSICTDTSYVGDYKCTCPSLKGGRLCNIANDSRFENGTSCSQLLAINDTLQSGQYLLDIDGTGPIAPAWFYCDMTTNGGGWTIIASYTGGDNEQPIVSDFEQREGNPLEFQYYNIDRASKQALSTQNERFVDGRGETLLKRKTGEWLRTSSPPFNGYLKSGAHKYNMTASTTPVIVESSSGSRSSAVQGYTTQNISGGGDFGISLAEFAFDFTNANATMTNSACYGHYLYSASGAVLDGDAGYESSLIIGSWVGTGSCNQLETGHLSFYIAVRDPSLFGSCHSNPCANNGTCVALTVIGYSCQCTAGFSGHHCEISICPVATTHTFNGKCFLANASPSIFSVAISNCRTAGASSGTYDWHLSSGRGQLGGSMLEKQLLVDFVLNMSSSDLSSNYMWTGGFGFLSGQYFWMDGSNNPFANVVGWSSPSPTLTPPTLYVAAPNWPVIVIKGGKYNRYMTNDAGSAVGAVAKSICSRFQLPYARCRAGEIYWQSSCYLLQTALKTWASAESSCVSQGGHLVTIESLAEQAFLVVEFQLTSSVQIGISSNGSGQYVWSSGSNSVYRFWDPSQPDSLVGCGYMANRWRATLTWDDDVCTVSYVSICERPADRISY